jgi:hypothetical protein
LTTLTLWQVLVSIHQDVHWALAVIDLENKALEYYNPAVGTGGDSYKYTANANPKDVLEDLVRTAPAVSCRKKPLAEFSDHFAPIDTYVCPVRAPCSHYKAFEQLLSGGLQKKLFDARGA